jgi:hypothetical protein
LLVNGAIDLYKRRYWIYDAPIDWGIWLGLAGGAGRFLLGYFAAALGLWMNLPLPL